MTRGLDALPDERDWRTVAACRGEDPDLFHAREGVGRNAYGPALRICAGCTVRKPCLQYALDNQPPSIDHGVWGGTVPEDRAQIRRCRTGDCEHGSHRRRP